MHTVTRAWPTLPPLQDSKSTRTLGANSTVTFILEKGGMTLLSGAKVYGLSLVALARSCKRGLGMRRGVRLIGDEQKGFGEEGGAAAIPGLVGEAKTDEKFQVKRE